MVGGVLQGVVVLHQAAASNPRKISIACRESHLGLLSRAPTCLRQELVSGGRLNVLEVHRRSRVRDVRVAGRAQHHDGYISGAVSRIDAWTHHPTTMLRLPNRVTVGASRRRAGYRQRPPRDTCAAMAPGDMGEIGDRHRTQSGIVTGNLTAGARRQDLATLSLSSSAGKATGTTRASAPACGDNVFQGLRAVQAGLGSVLVSGRIPAASRSRTVRSWAARASSSTGRPVRAETRLTSLLSSQEASDRRAVDLLLDGERVVRATGEMTAHEGVDLCIAEALVAGGRHLTHRIASRCCRTYRLGCCRAATARTGVCNAQAGLESRSGTDRVRRLWLKHWVRVELSSRAGDAESACLQANEA